MEWEGLGKSVVSCSRTTGATYSEIVDYVLELLNIQNLFSLPLLDTTPDLNFTFMNMQVEMF